MQHWARVIAVGEVAVGPGHPTFIIAEAGVNHDGNMEKAHELVTVAAEAGANAVKFQAFNADHLVQRTARKANYQQRTTNRDENQYEMLRRLEISIEDHLRLKEHAEQLGLVFLTTPFEEVTLDALDSLQLAAYKIASTDVTNPLMLRRVAKKGRPIFLSTGMCYLSEVEIALEAIHPWVTDVVVLHCTADYPANDLDVNLRVLQRLAVSFGVLVGYSDHTAGVGAGPLAVACGAVCLEKHFTLDTTSAGPDHAASLSPNQLGKFVRAVRQAERYMGKSIKMPTVKEIDTRAALQKSLVAARDLEKGAELTLGDIRGIRADGAGKPAIYADRLIGHKISRSYKAGELI